MKSRLSFLLCLPVLMLIAFNLPGRLVAAAEIPAARQPLAARDAAWMAVPPPGAFNKLSPANGATGVGISPLLDWGASANATGYAYCIDTVIDNNCTTPISTGTVHQKQLSGLNYSTRYEWQVVATNTSGVPTFANGSQTAFWTFTTQAPPPPGAFNKVSPANGATGAGILMVLYWEPSANDPGYAYCIDTTIDNNCTPFISTGSAHQKSLVLNYSTTYEWQAVATNPGGQTFANGSPTAFWTFTTQAPPPGAFNKVNPPAGLTGVVTNPILEWQPSTGATEYRYCIDGVVSGTCNSSWVSTGTNHQVQLSGLTPNTTYEWQVEAYNATGSTYANGSAAASWTFTTEPLPGPFTKLAPANEASGHPSTVTLDWSDSSGAAYYQFCIDTSINNTCNTGWNSTGTLSQVTLYGLSLSTRYEWQARAVNSAGQTYADGSATAYWIFNTMDPPPGAFNKLSPANGATGLSAILILDWSESSGAARYEWCVDPNINNTCDTSWQNIGTTHQVQLVGLSPSTQFEWQVRAVNGSGTTYAQGSATAWWTFTTAPLPAAFNKISPANGATGVPAIGAWLYWSESSGAKRYEFCIDTTIDNRCNGSWVDTGNIQPGQLVVLNYSTQYEWQVIAVNQSGTTYANGSIYASWTFTTQAPPPEAFNKLTPANEATGVANNPVLDWEASSGATEYLYCYDTVINNTCNGSWVSTGAAHQAQLNGLSNSTLYEWQVKAVNGGGTAYANGSSTAYWTFTTVMAAPTPFNKSAPANGASGVATNPTLAWQTSTGAVTYSYCYDTNINNACDAWWHTNLTNNQAQLSGLNSSTTYEWQVMAENLGGETFANNGTYWTFTTAGTSLLKIYLPLIIR